jgi:electron transfer flavoprotein alpha subunit
MKIIVCIKQVPDTAELTVDPETGTLNRQGAESILNPLDGNALEEALRLRERYGGEVAVVSMGPKQAEHSLREAVAMGADRGYLCSDKGFAGADTWATAVTLAGAVQKIGIPDIVLCGKQAIDGDTAQVPAELAVRLGTVFLPYVLKIHKIENGVLRAESMTDTGQFVLEASLPAVCSVVKDINTPRLITLPGWVKAFAADIPLLTNRELEFQKDSVGLSGSPTRVKKIVPVAHEKDVEFLDPDREEDLSRVLELLEKESPSGRPEAAPPGSTGSEAPRTSTDAGKTGIRPEQYPQPASADAGSSCGRKATVIGEIDPEEGCVRSVTFELLGEARRLSEKAGTAVTLLFAGAHLDEILRETPFPGAAAVYYAEMEPGLEGEVNALAETLTAALEEITPEFVLGPATLGGRAFMPLVASRLATGLTADCTRFDIDDETGLLLQTRPAFGGNIMATIACADRRPQMATARPHVLKPVEDGTAGGTPEIVRLGGRAAGTAKAAAMPPAGGTGNDRVVTAGTGGTGAARPAAAQTSPPVRVLERKRTISGESDIANSRIIVSGGRGLGGRAGFELLERFASEIGGAVGASRSAVEAGWIPYPQQVGQTGKTVQPAVYIACGISGAVQHLVGMHDAETVIAVNKDPDAPIFKAADYGFVADFSVFLRNLLKLREKERNG